MRILFFGTGAFGLPSLEALIKSPHPLVGVVTAPDKPQGRNLVLQPTRIHAWAIERGVPCIQTARVNDPAAIETIRAFNADLFVVIAYGALLSDSLLKIPSQMTLNVHASVLPEYRGASPIHKAMLDGRTATGVSVMRMTSRLDAGDVILKKETPILPEDSFDSLEARLSTLGALALLESVELIDSGKALFEPQDESKASYARKLTKEDGRIEWDSDAEEIARRIRALRRWPTCYTHYQGKRLILHEAVVVDWPSVGEPGTIAFVSAKEGLGIFTRDRVLAAQVMQWEGKKALPAGEFLKGCRFVIGEKFR